MKYKNLISYGLSDRFEQESALYEGMFLGRIVQLMLFHKTYFIKNRNENLGGNILC